MLNASFEGSAKVATVIVEVWRRPRFSVGGTLCHR